MDAQRAAIKFYIQAKRSALETLQIIQNACDSHAVSHQSVIPALIMVHLFL
jgi:hypothetical protein